MDKSPAPPPPKTVLVIDPDAATAAALLPGGRTVIRAATGEEGLALARSRRPGLVVVEALLPRMDGFTVIRLLKSDPRFRSLPVVMASARRLAQDILRAEEVGAATYVTKPFDPLRLREVVDGLLSRTERSEFSVEYSQRLPPPPRPASARPLVLLVGGEEEIPGRLEGALKAAGFEVRRFSRAEAALPVARAGDRVCVIADTALSGMDGYTLCLLLKYDARCRHIPVFLLSSRSHPYEPERGKTVRADGHLVPSADAGEIARSLLAALEKSLREKAASAAGPLWLDGFKTIG